LVPKKRSEIALFVVADACQGKGIGKALWDNFLESCKKLNESRVYVETNKMGASGFYEKLGFSHVSDFDSLILHCIESLRLMAWHAFMSTIVLISLRIRCAPR
jgi:ribosomal protein S18 acetylase RimI-like enzyme